MTNFRFIIMNDGKTQKCYAYLKFNNAIYKKLNLDILKGSKFKLPVGFITLNQHNGLITILYLIDKYDLSRESKMDHILYRENNRRMTFHFATSSIQKSNEILECLVYKIEKMIDYD